MRLSLSAKKFSKAEASLGLLAYLLLVHACQLTKTTIDVTDVSSLWVAPLEVTDVSSLWLQLHSVVVLES